MDLTGEAIRRTTAVEPLDYRLLGRWLGHMSRSRFRHDLISTAEPVPGEQALGWGAHYLIGTGIAVALAWARPDWPARPSLAPALVTGLLSTAAPWLIMQPAFGLGVAASRTPQPWLSRWRSLRTHAIYGTGLYLTARAMRAASPSDG